MNKNYFYASSYQTFLVALSYLNDKSLIGIISNNSNIIKFSKKIGIDCIQFGSYSSIEFLIRYNTIVKEIKRIKDVVGNSSIYFSHTQWDIFCFLFINIISKTNITYFLNFEQLYSIHKFDFNFQFYKMYLFKITFKLLYYVDLVVKKIGKKYLIGIGDKFFNKTKINIIDNKSTYKQEILRVIKKFKFTDIEITNLYIDDGYLFYKNNIDLDSLKVILFEIKDRKFYYKEHPTINSSRKLFGADKLLPKIIPVEFFLANVKNNVISVISSRINIWLFF